MLLQLHTCKYVCVVCVIRRQNNVLLYCSNYDIKQEMSLKTTISGVCKGHLDYFLSDSYNFTWSWKVPINTRGETTVKSVLSKPPADCLQDGAEMCGRLTTTQKKTILYVTTIKQSSKQ